MSFGSKARLFNASELKQGTPASSTVAKSSTPTNDQKGKQPCVFDPKVRPAVKDLSKLRYRSNPAVKNLSRSSKPTTSQESKGHEFIAATRTPSSPTTKIRASEESNTSKLLQSGTNIETWESRSIVDEPKHTLQEGRRDPYDLISDSEANDHPRNVFARSASLHKGILSSVDARMSKITSSRNLKRSQPSTHPHPSIKQSTDVSSSRRMHVPEGSQRFRPFTPAPASLDKQIILLDSSSSEDTGPPKTLKTHSPSTHRPSVSSSSPANILANSAKVLVDHSSRGRIVPAFVKSLQRRQFSSQRTQANIPIGAEVISIPDSSSESDEQQLDSKSPTATRLPPEAAKQNSPRFTSSHLNAIDKKEQDAISLSTDSSAIVRKRNRDSIACEGNDSPSSRCKQGSIPNEINKRHGLSTASDRNSVPLPGYVAPRANNVHTKEPEETDHRKTPSERMNAHDRYDGLGRSDKLADATTQQNTPALAETASQSKSTLQGQSSEPGDTEKDQTQLMRSRGARNPSLVLKDPRASKTVIRGKNKTVKTSLYNKGKRKATSKSPWQIPDQSDDEYKPALSNEGSSYESSDDGTLFLRRTPARDSSSASHSMPSPSSPRQRLRSGSYPKPTTSFTPINKPKSQTQKGEPAATLPMRPWSSKGQSKRGRTASGVTALGENEFQKEVDEQSTPHREGNNEDDTIPQLIEFERKSWWNPQAWIDRYETGFMIDFDVPGRLWLGLDPFKGWISDGPGKGTYMPGYEPPDDAAIAEAEKTAVLRYHLRTYDSDSEDYEQWKRDYFPDTRGLPEDECSPTQLASGVHQDTVATDIPECPVTDSKVKHPHCTSPSANFEQGPSSAHRTPSEVKALERAERVERTEQYVLTGNPGGGGINSQMTDLPTKNPDENTSPLSAASETTSTLIARQLIADCTSLSSQVLANLTNLSQADRNTRISSVTQRMSKQCDFDDRYASASGSSEPISSIPARPPSKMSLPLTPKRGLNMALGSEHPIDKQVDARAKPRWIIPPNVSTKTNIEVVLPYMPAEERAEYEAVSPIEYSSYSPQPPTSFREINEATPSVDLESDESGEETLKYVLRQSPRWLNNVTEINESGETTEANKTKVSSKLPINSSSRTPSMDLDTPQENSSHIPKAAATDTSCRSSNIEGRGKMMAYYPTSVFPSTELPLSKKQKMTDGGWDPRRDKKLSQRRRRRRRKLWEKRRRESKSSNSQLRFS